MCTYIASWILETVLILFLPKMCSVTTGMEAAVSEHCTSKFSVLLQLSFLQALTLVVCKPKYTWEYSALKKQKQKQKRHLGFTSDLLSQNLWDVASEILLKKEVSQDYSDSWNVESYWSIPMFPKPSLYK